MQIRRVLILGAAGRDFHNFNVVYRDDADFEVVAFTAQQIPHISDRRYPPELAGARYPHGIAIHDEAALEQLIRDLDVDVCVLSYSDLSHVEVMHLASRATSAGADFQILDARRTMLASSRPVIAVCASRTGAGKSQTSRAIVRAQHVTIEEREEYEPHIALGCVVYAGVDYEPITRQAEQEADVLIWDGGNNDTPFLVPNLYITVVDPHRAGHELSYHPGEVNVRMADVVIINKVDTATAAAVAQVSENVRGVNPRALLLEAESPITPDDASLLQGKRVLAVEDGPTLTHGGMAYGAASLAARAAGATLVDPRPFAVGEIADTFARYPSVGPLLPAMGYGEAQVRDLETTIANAARGGVDVVAIGTPIDLASLVEIPLPHTRVRYELRLRDDGAMQGLLDRVLHA